MQTRCYQFYATASQANAANRTILVPGVITSVKWAVAYDAVADNNQFFAELSFQSALQNTVDNAQGIIDAIGAANNLVTSGMTCNGFNYQTTDLYFPVGIGQVVFLNTNFAGAPNIRVLMYVVEK